MQIAVQMCNFDSIQRRAKVRKLKNREATGENEVTGDENKKKIWR